RGLQQPPPAQPIAAQVAQHLAVAERSLLLVVGVLVVVGHCRNSNGWRRRRPRMRLVAGGGASGAMGMDLGGTEGVVDPGGPRARGRASGLGPVRPSDEASGLS